MTVSIAKQKSLELSMKKWGVREADCEENFTRGTGPGGQKINKTSIVVVLKHLPTGFVVRCQKTRSQALNRYHARKLLIEKIEESILKEKSEKQKKIEKLRRQKRKRSKRAKEKVLEAKRIQGKKKELRKNPTASSLREGF